MQGERILVVDDEPQIQRFLKHALTAAGYEALPAADGASALRLLAGSAPDVVLLDLGLPDMDGKEVLAALRQWSRVPVIVLSARGREAEKIAALDLGADDYIEKPFGIGELLARLRTALRHRATQAGEETVFSAEGLGVDTLRRVVTRDGAPVRLTPREYELLAVLVKHAGRVVTHRQLLTSVWGPAHIDDVQYLRVFVGQLRAKIERDPDNPILLLTEPGVGYRLAEPP